MQSRTVSIALGTPAMHAAYDDTLDLLLELQHDLGKYVRLPLSFLPPDAKADEVHAALRRALLETRKGPGGVRSARTVWTDFLADGGEALRAQPGFAHLEAAVDRALAWEKVLEEGDAPVDRAAAEADVGAIAEAIRGLIRELQNHGD